MLALQSSEAFIRPQSVSRPDSGVDYYQKRYGAYAVLWLRVYIRAVFDFVQYRRSKSIRKRREYECAKRWLFDNDGGFDIVCSAFELPLERLRTKAMTMTKRDVKKLEHLERDGLFSRSIEALGGVGGGISR
jgi:hypothetical protein